MVFISKIGQFDGRSTSGRSVGGDRLKLDRSSGGGQNNILIHVCVCRRHNFHWVLAFE